MSSTYGKYIWHNGQFLPWDEANIHIMSHVIHYGSSVFEGIRVYDTFQGAAAYRLGHLRPHHLEARFAQPGHVLLESAGHLHGLVVDSMSGDVLKRWALRPVRAKVSERLGSSGLGLRGSASAR